MHGLKIIETTRGSRPLQQASLAVIGLVATATAEPGAATTALNAAFPLNTPVLITDVDASIGAAGTGGTLKPALESIASEATPVIVAVRVAPGNDQAATDAAVIGSTDGSTYTGIQALLAAQAVLGVRPRILGAPGLDSQAVTAALVIAAKKLRAMVYAYANATDVASANTYRDQFGARELMLLWPEHSKTVAGIAVGHALGKRAAIDETQGWHKTLSNVVINGPVDLAHDVHWDLQDESTDAGLLNAAPITTTIRNNGYRFWGNRTCAGEDQPEFAFESAVRTSHALQDIIAGAVAPFIDHPMTIGLVKDLLETVNAALRAEIGRGRLIGGVASFDPTKNSPEQLAAGRPTITLKYTPVAPLENPIVELVNTAEFYAGFADQLA